MKKKVLFGFLTALSAAGLSARYMRRKREAEGLSRKVDDLTARLQKAEAALQTQRAYSDEAAGLEAMRSEFAANVTHELKTPLTSIMGYIELLKAGPREEAVRDNFYEIIQIEAERLQNLIDDLLLLSEIESNKDAHVQECDVSEILEKAAAALSVSADKRGVSLEIEAGERLPMTADPRRLHQLFVNLLDNAVKYNRPGGRVRATASAGSARLTVTVADTGIGIDPSHFERLFERFYRVDKSRSRKMGGTGLGLSIVKHIVQLYGGEIGVESVPGEGTAFTVRLPLQPDAREGKS